MSTEIARKKGDAFDIQFTYTVDGAVVDVSGDTFMFVIKEKPQDSTALVEKLDAVFTKTSGSIGIVTCNITATNTNALGIGLFYGEIRKTASSTDVYRSDRIDISIEEAAI